MIKVAVKDDFSKTLKYMGKMKTRIKFADKTGLGILEKYAKEGVAALMAATPVDTGKTARSWYYTIERNGSTISINFANSNIVNYIPIAIILQYGHATGTGGWVEGRDYINPAIRPIFERLAQDAWKEVSGT